MNRCMIVLLVWFTMASAHSGSRLYPIYELTDEMLSELSDLPAGTNNRICHFSVGPVGIMRTSDRVDHCRELFGSDPPP